MGIFSRYLIFVAEVNKVANEDAGRVQKISIFLCHKIGTEHQGSTKSIKIGAALNNKLRSLSSAFIKKSLRKTSS